MAADAFNGERGVAGLGNCAVLREVTVVRVGIIEQPFSEKAPDDVGDGFATSGRFRLSWCPELVGDADGSTVVSMIPGGLWGG